MSHFSRVDGVVRHVNTFWACEKHANNSTLRCAVCDEEQIAKLSERIGVVAMDALSKSVKLAKANKQIEKLKAEIDELKFALADNGVFGYDYPDH